MYATRGWAAGRAKARIRAFELIQEIQTGAPGAPGELEALIGSARDEGYGEVVRVGMFGRAVRSWIEQDPSLARDVDALVSVSRKDGDDCMTALGLAMRAAFVVEGILGPASPAFDGDLAEAVVLLESAEGEALEMMSAHTACGIAFDYRSMWELGDEQYAAAIARAGRADPGVGDTLLAAVMFNRVEAQVSWASRLRQLGDQVALADRWRAWGAVMARSGAYGMPAPWLTELEALGHLMAAVTGAAPVDVADQMLATLRAEGRDDPRTSGHLELAGALIAVDAKAPDAYERAGRAVEAIDREAFPLLYDLALYIAAEVEATTGPTSGLRCADIQIRHRWADRLAQLESMRSRIASTRLVSELARVSEEARRDDLTGLGNRRALGLFMTDLDRRGVAKVAVIMVDVDRFKMVNDRFGHGTGDAVLGRLAVHLEAGIRPSDLAIRLGGDEFLVVLADAELATAAERAAVLMDQIKADRWGVISDGLQISVSMGVSGGPVAELGAVRAGADHALYDAKRAGGNRISVAGTD
ncbi:MAG TPA: GGDEF domain-containing protein [Acidimicrobiales bacterium]|jgi:diguanylate cyclase (GGDEF)-like protein|nr:GGDEF domain-containing protein [Acidimicrobiales bacterium]